MPDPAEAGDRRSETWVLWDRQLVDDELYALWGLFRPASGSSVVSDSCHSGTVSRALRELNAELSRQTEEARAVAERLGSGCGRSGHALSRGGQPAGRRRTARPPTPRREQS